MITFRPCRDALATDCHRLPHRLTHARTEDKARCRLRQSLSSFSTQPAAAVSTAPDSTPSTAPESLARTGPNQPTWPVQPINMPSRTLRRHRTSTATQPQTHTFAQVTADIRQGGSGTAQPISRFPRSQPVVDPMWQNPNHTHAVQGPIVTLTAVRRRLP
ncbi:hypothetical protein GCM10010532_030580 [Dactylosporangium siamense]|uniref:Uncharacterized protein n=1 Tax=Dactylosporangium siamense TaxID=685454 RepID=A0A919U6Z0_9ACTN|nr:hypothetical protein Dsi01nite_020330 [Dactylosporangium siamense]